MSLFLAAILRFVRWRPAVVILIAGLLVPAVPAAVATGTIEGRVFNASSGLYLNKARVAVVGTAIEALSSDTGEFRLTGVPAGEVKVKASYSGQQDVLLAVPVVAGGTATANVTFNAAAGAAGQEAGVQRLDAFVIEEARYRTAREIATHEERVTPNIKSVVALDSLGYVADGNVGEFVRFLPGVDVANASSSGNAANPDSAVSVSVRGFGADSTAVLIDGMPVASGSGESLTRTVQLDSLSINNASRLEIIKVATPDMPQNSPGGAINLITRGAFELARPSYDLSVVLNGNTNSPELLRKTPGPYGPSLKTRPSVRFSASYPLSRTLGLTFSISRDDKYSLTRNSNMRDWFLTGKTTTATGVTTAVTNARGGIRIDNPVIDRFELVDNQWLDKRNSGNVRFDWRPLPGLEIRANGQLSTMENTGVYRRTQWRYSNGVGIADWGEGFVTGRQRTATFNPGYSVGMTTDARDREGFTTAGYLSLNYRRNLWTVSARASASESYNALPDQKNGHFSTVDASLSPGRIDLSGVSQGVVGNIRAWDVGGNPLDYGRMSAWNPVLSSSFQARTSEVLSRDLVKQYNLDVVRDLDLRRDLANVTVKFGGQQKEKGNHKWGRGTSWRWNYVGPATGLPPNSELESDFATETRYGYNTPQYWADPSKIYRYYQAHPEYFSEGFVSPASNVNLLANNYLSRIGTAKGLTTTDSDWYGMVTARLFHSRLTIIAGARQTMQEINGYNVFNDTKYQFVKLKDGQLYRDATYPNGIRFDGAANSSPVVAARARDVIITDPALRARLQAAGVLFLPSRLELAPDGVATGTRDNNLFLAQLNRYTRYLDSSLKQPATPQVQVAYEITPNLRLQAAWSRETRLPDLEGSQGLIIGGASFQVNPADLPTDVPGGDGAITIANVQGRPEINQSYNAKLSYYPKNGKGRYSVSYYYKVVDKSWETVTIYNTDSSYDSLLESMGLSADEYRNYSISTTTATGLKQIRKGFELEAEQNLGALASWLQGWDVFATYTRRPVTARSPAAGLGFVTMTPVRAKWTGGLNYSARRYSLRAMWTYTEAGVTHSAATAVTMPDGTSNSVWFYNLNKVPPEVNVQANYTLSRRFSLFATGNRVLSARVRGQIADSFTGLMPDWASYRTLQDRGIAISAGIRAHF